MDTTMRDEQEVGTDEQKLEILVVEDSRVQAKGLQQLLERNGYGVSITYNGREALTYLERRLPSLVISDVVMPEMNGYELCKAIKNKDHLKKVPVLLLTVLSDPEDIVNGIDCGADNYLTKPYNEDELISRVQYVLLNKKLRDRHGTEVGVKFFFAGKSYTVDSDRIQILDLLLCTYESVLRKHRELEWANKELNRVNQELRTAVQTIKKLSGIIPICSKCKKIRDEEGVWQYLETYIEHHSEAGFSHGLCPECADEHYPEFFRDKKI